MRFIQIAVALDAEGNESLYALGIDGAIYHKAEAYYRPGHKYEGRSITRGNVNTDPFWRKVELPFTEPPLEDRKLRMLEFAAEISDE